jgi:hypothetical protein
VPLHSAREIRARATFYNTLIKRYAEEHILKKSAIYLACFCEKPTLLSQWRAYGDNGHGYCVGISHDGLETATLASVLYVANEVEQGFCERPDKFCTTLERGWSSLPQSDQLTAINRAYNYVLMIAAKYAVRSKHIV